MMQPFSGSVNGRKRPPVPKCNFRLQHFSREDFGQDFLRQFPRNGYIAVAFSSGRAGAGENHGCISKETHKNGRCARQHHERRNSVRVHAPRGAAATSAGSTTARRNPVFDNRPAAADNTAEHDVEHDNTDKRLGRRSVRRRGRKPTINVSFPGAADAVPGNPPHRKLMDSGRSSPSSRLEHGL